MKIQNGFRFHENCLKCEYFIENAFIYLTGMFYAIINSIKRLRCMYSNILHI